MPTKPLRKLSLRMRPEQKAALQLATAQAGVADKTLKVPENKDPTA